MIDKQEGKHINAVLGCMATIATIAEIVLCVLTAELSQATMSIVATIVIAAILAVVMIAILLKTVHSKTHYIIVMSVWVSGTLLMFGLLLPLKSAATMNVLTSLILAGIVAKALTTVHMLKLKAKNPPFFSHLEIREKNHE
jgi:hypothetical protein